MKKKAIDYYGTFEGIYTWGGGYINPEKKAAWDRFWLWEFPKKHCTFWKRYVAPSPEEFGVCGSLVGTSKAIYMHPMGFYGVFVEGGVTCRRSLPEEDYKYDYTYTFLNELNELREICEECAKYCGGTFTLDTTKEFDIEIPEERFDLTTEEDYLHQCAERSVAR